MLDKYLEGQPGIEVTRSRVGAFAKTIMQGMLTSSDKLHADPLRRSEWKRAGQLVVREGSARATCALIAAAELLSR